VSDAGCDPKAAFEDLGNAVRKIRIDLRVEIEVQTGRITSRDNWKEDTSTYFAVGEIKYPDAALGQLLYIKPSCPSGVSADVRAYSLQARIFRMSRPLINGSASLNSRVIGVSAPVWWTGLDVEPTPRTMSRRAMQSPGSRSFSTTFPRRSRRRNSQLPRRTLIKAAGQ
jgi:hypothetical protein